MNYHVLSLWDTLQIKSAGKVNLMILEDMKAKQ